MSARINTKSGQALLIVLLTMAVVLTIVLSVLSRSVTDIAVTSREEESLRAFSAAEAGVEQALVRGNLSGTFADTQAAYDADLDEIGKGEQSFAYPLEIASGDTATVWFVAHDDAGSLVCDLSNPCFTGNQISICWGSDEGYTNPDIIPAVELSVVYTTTPGDYSTARIARAAFDPNSARTASNRFTPAISSGCTIDGTSFPFRSSLSLSSLNIPASVYTTQNGLQLGVVRMLYNDSPSPFGVETDGVLPSQGKSIVSTGTSGESTRKIEVVRLFADLPAVFYSAIFSTTGITK